MQHREIVDATNEFTKTKLVVNLPKLQYYYKKAEMHVEE